MKRSITGFTIVELLIVIVVIAILAAVSVVAYTGIQNRANDSRIRAGVKQLETALRVYAQDHSLPIRGGSGSSVAVSNGECSDGLSGFLGSGVYTCSVEDALISAGVLQGSLTQTLPANTYHDDDNKEFHDCEAGNASFHVATIALGLYMGNDSRHDNPCSD